MIEAGLRIYGLIGKYHPPWCRDIGNNWETELVKEYPLRNPWMPAGYLTLFLKMIGKFPL